MNPALLAIAIEQAPAVIEWLKSLFKKRNPGAPEPSEAEIITAFNQAFVSSLAKDEAWLAAHPQLPPV